MLVVEQRVARVVVARHVVSWGVRVNRWLGEYFGPTGCVT